MSESSRMQLQATFTLESIVDGKQRFSLENLYIILPEKVESVQKNQMEFLFKHESESEAVTTPVKPIQKVVPSAPVKASSAPPQLVDSPTQCKCWSCTNRQNLNEAKSVDQEEVTTEQLDLFQQCAKNRGVTITENDKWGWGINYNNFLKYRKYNKTSLDKPLKDQINDYLYSVYAPPSMELREEYEDWNRLCLLRKLFDQQRLQWQHSYFGLYRGWSVTHGKPQGSNRYKKMMQFLNEYRALFTSF